MKTIKVKELKKGDELGGCTVVETPILICDYCGSRFTAIRVLYF